MTLTSARPHLSSYFTRTGVIMTMMSGNAGGGTERGVKPKLQFVTIVHSNLMAPCYNNLYVEIKQETHYGLLFSKMH
jgi:hypothetical protein